MLLSDEVGDGDADIEGGVGADVVEPRVSSGLVMLEDVSASGAGSVDPTSSFDSSGSGGGVVAAVEVDTDEVTAEFEDTTAGDDEGNDDVGTELVAVDM